MVIILLGWLFQVARHRYLDELRRRPEVPFSTLEREDGEEGLSPLGAIDDPEPLPREMTESNDLHGSLHAAIVSLPRSFVRSCTCAVSGN
jgi:DNA-directed RNA polymerase specialized sigma24 family protein